MKAIFRHFTLSATVAWLCLSGMTVAGTNVISKNTTIGVTNHVYDGESLIVSNATLTINGEHAFEDLILAHNAKVTHSAATTSAEYSMAVTVSNLLLIVSNSSINVAGCGYRVGRTFGNTTNGAATGRGGGSYGGMGGVYYAADTVNPVYGDFRNPNELGSGGASGNSYGGGLVRLSARELVVDGAIRADGAAGGSSAPGGSGGGIYIEADRISGVGVVTVNGGNGGSSVYGGGGGGRIAIHYGEVSGMVLTNQVWAMGGSNGSSSAGTVYLRP
ncbi:MAG: hypothetical protein PHR35_04590, partial [Kiritimatiellae bacterium]|nr:hypothetical protein [Kiritimatiellia bacterium]